MTTAWAQAEDDAFLAQQLLQYNQNTSYDCGRMPKQMSEAEFKLFEDSRDTSETQVYRQRNDALNNLHHSTAESVQYPHGQILTRRPHLQMAAPPTIDNHMSVYAPYYGQDSQMIPSIFGGNHVSRYYPGFNSRLLHQDTNYAGLHASPYLPQPLTAMPDLEMSDGAGFQADKVVTVKSVEAIERAASQTPDDEDESNEASSKDEISEGILSVPEWLSISTDKLAFYTCDKRFKKSRTSWSASATMAALHSQKERVQPRPLDGDPTLTETDKDLEDYAKAVYDAIIDFSGFTGGAAATVKPMFNGTLKAETIQVRSLQLVVAVDSLHKHGAEVPRSCDPNRRGEKLIAGHEQDTRFGDRLENICDALRLSKLLCMDVLNHKKDLLPIILAPKKAIKEKLGYEASNRTRAKKGMKLKLSEGVTELVVTDETFGG